MFLKLKYVQKMSLNIAILPLNPVSESLSTGILPSVLTSRLSSQGWFILTLQEALPARDNID